MIDNDTPDEVRAIDADQLALIEALDVLPLEKWKVVARHCVPALLAQGEPGTNTLVEIVEREARRRSTMDREKELTHYTFEVMQDLGVRLRVNPV